MIVEIRRATTRGCGVVPRTNKKKKRFEPKFHLLSERPHGIDDYQFQQGSVLVEAINYDKFGVSIYEGFRLPNVESKSSLQVCYRAVRDIKMHGASHVGQQVA